MKTKTIFSRGRGLKLLLLSPFLYFILGVGAFAVPALADNLAQGFSAKGNLSAGMMVALAKNSENTVEVAPAADSSRIFGVVIDPRDAPLILNRNSGDQIFVTSSGTYQVLVDTERGPVAIGDYVSISSTDGIGAKATFSQSLVLGQAATAFDGKTGSITKVGAYPVGKVTVTINPRKNPLVKNDIAIPLFLRKLGEGIAGKPISAIHIYAALAFLAAAITIATSMLAAGVRGGMIALGRNPLNRGPIMNSMFKVVSASVLIFVIGLAGVYLLLKI